MVHITLSLGLRQAPQVALVYLERREVCSLMILSQVHLHTPLDSHPNSVKAVMIAPLITLGGLIPSDLKTLESSLRKVVFPGLTPLAAPKERLCQDLMQGIAHGILVGLTLLMMPIHLVQVDLLKHLEAGLPLSFDMLSALIGIVSCELVCQYKVWILSELRHFDAIDIHFAGHFYCLPCVQFPSPTHVQSGQVGLYLFFFVIIFFIV